MTPEALLAGPRGRRMCLELAMWAGGEACRPVWDAAHAFDPTDGSVTMLAIAAPPGTQQEEIDQALAESANRPVPTPEQAADALRGLGVDPGWPSDSDIARALSMAVDTARYWEPSDGEDLLAATAPVRAALVPVAELVCTHPAAAWWTDAMGADQVAITWAGVDEVTHTAPGALRRWRAAAVVSEERTQRERPRDVSANYSGEWWSTPALAGCLTSTRAIEGDPVGFTLVEDAFGWTSATVRPVVAEGARLVEVTGAQEWIDLCRRFPLTLTVSRRHDWYRVTGLDTHWVIPDWSEIAREADGVHLSVAAYLTSAGRALEVEDGLHTLIAGWGPDQTYWLTDIARAEGAPGVWRRTQNDGIWARS